MTMMIKVRHNGPKDYLAMVSRGAEAHTLSEGQEVELSCWPGACITVQEASTETDERLRTEPMMRWFAFRHLPADLQAVSSPYYEIARNLVLRLNGSAERTVALRKLLESKDAAVRAALPPLPAP